MENNKIGIVIPCYNRPDYLKQTLDCFCATEFLYPTTVFIIDDKSDSDTRQIIANYYNDKFELIKIFNENNYGIAYNLFYGFKYFHDRNFNIFINIDPDMLMESNWLIKGVELLKAFPDRICSSWGAEDTERYKILKETENYTERRSIGGANYIFNNFCYETIMEALQKTHTFDWHLCTLQVKKNIPFVCANPSLMKHIGEESSMGHKYFK
jgi:glycosyltransferase involved in cell wall biosynthesis